MSLMDDLLERPFDQAITSKYTAMNGLIYLGFGALILVWPGMVQTIFRDAAFVGNEAALIRVMGMTVMIIGSWCHRPQAQHDDLCPHDLHQPELQSREPRLPFGRL